MKILNDIIYKKVVGKSFKVLPFLMKRFKEIKSQLFQVVVYS